MTAKWTDVITTTVPERVEREETESELWTRRRSAYRCVTEPATPTEIGRGLQALEPAERAEALTAAGVEPTQPATPEEIGEVLAGLEPDERGRALDAAGVPSATPEELAAVVAALPPDEHRRVLRALGYGAAPARVPEALGAELAALDVCEFMRAARAAGIVEARRLPRSSSPPLSVGGVPIMWSEITVTAVGGGGGGRELFHAAGGGGGGGGGAPGAELDRLREELRERERDQLRAERGMDHWRERATAAEHAEREATATADRAQAARDRAQAERDKAVALQDAAVNRLAVLERERDQAEVRARNERNGAAGLRDALAAMKRERDGARDALAVTLSAADACATATAARLAGERDRARAERDRYAAAERTTRAERDVARAKLAEVTQARDVAHAQLVTELGRVRELATERDRVRIELAALREALNQPALGAYRLEQTGARAAAVTEDDGASVEVRVGCMSNLVRVPGDRWVCLGSILRAAHAAGALP